MRRFLISQLAETYPIMKEKDGANIRYFDKNAILRENSKDSLLIFVVGGKTEEYCKTNFQYFDVLNAQDPYIVAKAAQQLESTKLTVIKGAYELRVRAEILTALEKEYTKSIILIVSNTNRAVPKFNLVETEKAVIENAYVKYQLDRGLIGLGVDEITDQIYFL